MPDRKFMCSLRCSGERVETTPHRVMLSPVAPRAEGHERYSHLNPVPVHEADTVNAGSEADCHLQLWEMDFYRTSTYRQDEEHEFRNPRRNQLLGSVPGVVVHSGRTYRFQPTGNPVLTTATVDPQNGSVKLSLRPAGETDSRQIVFPLDEYEGVLELAAILRLEAGNTDLQNNRTLPPYQVHNIQASLRRQIGERGGFAMAFVTNYDPDATPPRRRPPASAPAADQEAFRRHVKQSEFHKQAEEMICVLPTFTAEDGAVAMGYCRITSKDQIAGQMQTTRQAVQRLLGLAEAPRIATLTLYGHGSRTSLQMVYTGWGHSQDWRADGTLQTRNTEAFVQQIRPHLAQRPVVALFACSCGCGIPPNRDNRFGRPYPCEELGGDSLGWTLELELRRQQVDHPTVWAHTTAAHATRNPNLRVFSEYGTADAVNLLVRAPNVSQATTGAYLRSVSTGSDALHNKNLIRTLCLQSALYFDWRWNGGTQATGTTPGFSTEANREADTVYDEIRGLGLSTATGLRDDVIYEDRTRRFITGLRSGLTEARLSENFSFSELRDLAAPFRVSVKLLKSLQLLRYRTRRGMTPIAIREGGLAIVVRASPNTAPNRNRLARAAQRMVEQGLFSWTSERGDDLLLMVDRLPLGDWNTPTDGDAVV